MRTLTALTTLPAMLLALAAHAEFEPVGTVTALVDGEQRTWYIPGDETGDGGSGAMWMQVEPGTATAVLGGFESRDVRFGRNPDSGVPTVAGEGSQISLSFQFPEGAQQLEARLPTRGNEAVSLLLLPRVGDYRAMYAMEEGHLKVTTLQINRSGTSVFSGEFEGVLRDDEGEVVHRLEKGQFSVEGASFFDLEEAEQP